MRTPLKVRVTGRELCLRPLRPIEPPQNKVNERDGVRTVAKRAKPRSCRSECRGGAGGEDDSESGGGCRRRRRASACSSDARYKLQSSLGLGRAPQLRPLTFRYLWERKAQIGVTCWLRGRRKLRTTMLSTLLLHARDTFLDKGWNHIFERRD